MIEKRVDTTGALVGMALGGTMPLLSPEFSWRFEVSG